MPAEMTACIGIEICAALGAAHEKKIIHRDVKPENILLHENRELVLTDFGIADMVDSQSMTATGQILGSPGHMAPEQIEGGHTDARTDVFALGTVLYYLATGRLPFTGKNPHQILKRIADGEYADPLRMAPRIGGRFAAILRKSLERDADARYSSAEALSEALRAFVLEVGIEDPHGALAKFLASPAEEMAALLPKTIAANVTLGKAARDAGRFAEASDRFGRVLSLDEGNAEVLALLERMQKEARRPGGGAVAGVALALVALSAGVWAAATQPWAGTGTSGPDAGTSAGTDAALLVAPGEDDVGLAEDAGGAPDARDDASEPLDAGRDAPRRETPRVGGTRRVVFSPDPAGVSISIDEGPARSPIELERMGGVELSVGAHRVHYTPNEGVDCCLEESFPFNVVAGEGEMRVAHVLASQPAGLLVIATGALGSGVGGTVSIGSVRGRTRSVLSVPMRSSATRRERVTYRVEAAGYRPFSAEVELRAGELTELEITLEPESAPEPETPPEGTTPP